VNPRYPDVARRAGHRCEYCRAPEVVFNFPFEVEHVTPTSEGGTDEVTNLALACRACNVRKSNVITVFDEVTGEDVPLFDPRSDRWADHFAFDPDTCELTGLTAVGRVTIARLGMNDAPQLASRHLWVRLRVYP
jgi:hypothetical protein